MNSKGDLSETLKKSMFIATTRLVGGVVIGVSALGIYYSFPLGKKKKKKPVRVYMGGCFDMMHYGHCNALRQARDLGDQLVVGVVSDAEITLNKGHPVTPLQERMIMLSAIKWVDEVIPDAPYAITEEFMKRLFDVYNIDYIVHGDDPCLLPDGTDAYALAKKVGRYKQIKRTEGVSSTDIVGRMLFCARKRSSGENQNLSSLQRKFSKTKPNRALSPNQLGSAMQRKFSHDGGFGSATRIFHFIPTSRRFVQFSNGKGGPGPLDRIVYIAGSFDIFRAGHVEMLKLARSLGDFLIVGIHTDQTIRARKGAHHPIMKLHERSLSVLACRYVDEVIIGAPLEVSKDMITTFDISLVIHGVVADDPDFLKAKPFPYEVPDRMGIFKVLESPLDIRTSTIIRRIVANHRAFQKRIEEVVDDDEVYTRVW